MEHKVITLGDDASVRRGRINHDLMFGLVTDPDVCARQAVARGVVRYEIKTQPSLTKAAARIGVSLRTLRRWIERCPDLTQPGLECIDP
jgi:hypothetical protein